MSAAVRRRTQNKAAVSAADTHAKPSKRFLLSSSKLSQTKKSFSSAPLQVAGQSERESSDATLENTRLSEANPMRGQLRGFAHFSNRTNMKNGFKQSLEQTLAPQGEKKHLLSNRPNLKRKTCLKHLHWLRVGHPQCLNQRRPDQKLSCDDASPVFSPSPFVLRLPRQKLQIFQSTVTSFNIRLHS